MFYRININPNIKPIHRTNKINQSSTFSFKNNLNIGTTLNNNKNTKICQNYRYYSTEVQEPLCKLGVTGVGGAGSNVVDTMVKSKLSGVDFFVVNTDAQSLLENSCENKIQIGNKITRGTGAGSQPEIGRRSAEEAAKDIKSKLKHYNMMFVTAGMGGGTGTGAAPVVARAARDTGAITVGVVTLPFKFEGRRRMRVALDGLKELEKSVNTLIVINNQKLFEVAEDSTGFEEAFTMADAVLEQGINGIADVIVRPGLINLDFADVRTVMEKGGRAFIGTGIAEGEDREDKAVKRALENPLLGLSHVRGARHVLLSVSGGSDIGLHEVQHISDAVRKEVAEDANLILGASLDDTLDGKVKVTLVVSGIPEEGNISPEELNHKNETNDISNETPHHHEENDDPYEPGKIRSVQQNSVEEEQESESKNDNESKSTQIQNAFMKWLKDGKWW
uniref:Mitochondrial FtsZ2 n=1 Tax=Pharyngomonas kirbyi TaxID=63601 RepID=A0A0E3X2J3_9EUKA|nr:mitochondrial FtsZ2 [Pharyngomonas kirbyi]|eukprot:gb/GECH01002407.1/.p1 GENE.gb/GECH01002407.1/~~gb/GECH01002407.1/.p1  ORF type:complete len:448 (+),score=115.43 gb/GECH01002407.1/:1-1344(+)